MEEVLSQSTDPKAYDWRTSSLEIDFNYANIYEANIFESRNFGLGVTTSLSGPWLIRGAVRRAITKSTNSSEQMALTIYSQAAQPSRFELLGGIGYRLLDGRSATALSPRITDIGHSLVVMLNLQYNKFDSDEPAPIPAMRAIYYNLIAEAGLKFQVFLPASLGLGIEWTYSRPLQGSDPDLPAWQRFGGSLSWSFGQ